MELQYIYLIQEREFIHLEKPIFKVGKTKQRNFTRFTQYPKESALIFQSACNNCDLCEKEILQLFKKKYEQKKNIGTEYFEGDYTCMLSDISDIITQQWKKQKVIDQERKVIEAEFKRKLEDELREKIEDELREKIEDEIRQNNRDERRGKIEDDLRQKIRDELRENKKGNEENNNEWTGEYKHSCTTCKFSTKTTYCLEVHFATKKHLRNEQPRITDSEIKFRCKTCNNHYQFASGLSAHNKKCIRLFIPNDIDTTLVVSSQELQISTF